MDELHYQRELATSLLDREQYADVWPFKGASNVPHRVLSNNTHGTLEDKHAAG